MRDWTPQLSHDGVYYCSPACGCRCKKADYDLVVARAATLAETMGFGWEPVVWENAGWHYRAISGQMSIYPSNPRDEPPTYTAYIKPNVLFNGTKISIAADANDPHDALGIAKQEAWAAISSFRDAMAEQEPDTAGGRP